MNERFVPPYLKKQAVSIYTRQLLSDTSQLTRLQSKYPSMNDQTILAEAAHLCEVYNEEEETEMFLASTDCAFSPVLHKDGTVRSGTVTKEIAERFLVHCDWPERIATVLRPFYP